MRAGASARPLLLAGVGVGRRPLPKNRGQGKVFAKHCHQITYFV